MNEKETYVRIGHGDTEERFVVRESVSNIADQMESIFGGQLNFICLTKIKTRNEYMPAEEINICVSPNLLPVFEFWEQEKRLLERLAAKGGLKNRSAKKRSRS